MKYIFVINGRYDKNDSLPEIQKQIDELCPGAMQYRTIGVGDGTRFVRSYCEFHQKEEVCFVACGGRGEESVRRRAAARILSECGRV